jgi:hypothetical protein
MISHSIMLWSYELYENLIHFTVELEKRFLEHLMLICSRIEEVLRLELSLLFL